MLCLTVMLRGLKHGKTQLNLVIPLNLKIRKTVAVSIPLQHVVELSSAPKRVRSRFIIKLNLSLIFSSSHHRLLFTLQSFKKEIYDD